MECALSFSERIIECALRMEGAFSGSGTSENCVALPHKMSLNVMSLDVTNSSGKLEMAPNFSCLHVFNGSTKVLRFPRIGRTFLGLFCTFFQTDIS